jgi:hypothetical protein
VEGVKRLLEREKGQTIEIKSGQSPELTVLDREALNRAVSALDAKNNRKGNSIGRLAKKHWVQFSRRLRKKKNLKKRALS